MKLSALFGKFLYQYKELKLPGIGIFTLDPSIPIPDVADKNQAGFTQHIRFVQAPVTQADESLINFIRTETGKIKPLAESDLDSFLSDGKILLNIGKPFHLEGIGYLQKTREGVYEFTPGEATLHRASAHHAQEHHEEPAKKSFYSDEPAEPNKLRKTLSIAGLVAGIALVIWLGYSLYNRSSNRMATAEPDTAAVAPEPRQDANVLLDSVQRKIDSARAAATALPTSSGYKFIIEKTNRTRAYRRYNQIKESLTDIRMETADSTQFNLFFVIPAQPADTARIRDSLKVWYARKTVWIEPAR